MLQKFFILLAMGFLLPVALAAFETSGVYTASGTAASSLSFNTALAAGFPGIGSLSSAHYTMQLGMVYIFEIDLNAEMPDFNFWMLNSRDLNAAPFYLKPAPGASVIFAVTDPQNARLAFDFNISSSPSEGSGTVFAQDLNITRVYCVPQDWQNEVSICLLEFSPPAFYNGSYYLLGKIKNTILPKFKISPMFYYDSLPPAVNTILTHGFFIKGASIKGNGYFYAGVSDSGSGLNTASCETSKTGAWEPGIFAASSCGSNNFAIDSNVEYSFNTRISDNAGNTGEGAALYFLGNTQIVNPEEITNEDFRNVGNFFTYSMIMSFAEVCGTIILMVASTWMLYVLLFRKTQ